MTISPLPVSFASNAVTGVPVRYKVISQSGRNVIVQDDRCWPLSLGQMIVFNTNARGIVTDLLNDDTANVLLSTTTNGALEASADDWLRFDPPRIMLYKDLSSIGSLRVVCSNSATTRSGFIGWSFYSDNQIVARGNDFDELHVCQFTGDSVWGPGNYRLEVRSFLPNPLQPLRYATKQWDLTESTSKLSMGGFNDMESKLRLD